MQGPILIAKEFMAKSDLNLCAQKYTVMCLLRLWLSTVSWPICMQTSFSVDVALNRQCHQEAWKFYCSRSNLTNCKEVLIWTEMNTWIQCFAKCVLSITCLTHLLDVFALINCMLSF